MTDPPPTVDRRFLLGTAGSLLAVGLAGCSARSGTNEGPAITRSTSETATPPTPLQITPSSASVGDQIHINGSELPPDTDLTLTWERVTGQWSILKSSTVAGATFTAAPEPVKSVHVDHTGGLSATMTVPEDHGGRHTITVKSGESTHGKGQLTVTPTFTLDKQHAPIGEAFTVSVTGMPVSKYRRVDQVLWDNRFTGLVTGVTNRGTVRARVPAVGPPGTHVIEIGGGYEGVTYLNPQQSPYPRPFRYAHWTVTVTRPERAPGTTWRRPTVEESPLSQFYPAVDNPSGSLTVSPSSGVVGASMRIDGEGFPPQTSIQLEWFTMTGSRVSGNGFSSTAHPLTEVESDGNGRFSTTVGVPDDLGGTHPILATIDGTSRAVTGFVIQPSIIDFRPTAGPVGTPIDIHLKGVGWTEYDNIYAVTYDNDFVGYGCGFNTGGDVQMQFRASGRPGLHVINCFPAMYKTPDEKRTVGYYTKPQLTFLDDHPVRPLPEMGFLFEVTE